MKFTKIFLSKLRTLRKIEQNRGVVKIKKTNKLQYPNPKVEIAKGGTRFVIFIFGLRYKTPLKYLFKNISILKQTTIKIFA